MDLLDNLCVNFNLFDQLSAVIFLANYLSLRWRRQIRFFTVVESADYFLLQAESSLCDIFIHFFYYENY
jgi:hypothetical protein